MHIFDATQSTAEDLRSKGFGTQLIEKIIARRTDSENELRKKAGK
jgi:uncharacterized protein (UPF0335 family)